MHSLTTNNDTQKFGDTQVDLQEALRQFKHQEELNLLQKRVQRLEDALLTSQNKKQYMIGQIVEFGTYPQWRDADGTILKQPLKWQVLAQNGSHYLLHSCFGLNCQRYNNESVNTTWESCTLRTWLNNEFLQHAFNDQERQSIIEISNTNPDNPEHGTNGGHRTIDKIFLLSAEEVNNYYYSNNDRCRMPTDYAVECGVLTDKNTNSWWWLRSPGSASNTAAVVYVEGDIGFSGAGVSIDNIAVLPALWVEP